MTTKAFYLSREVRDVTEEELIRSCIEHGRSYQNATLLPEFAEVPLQVLESAAGFYIGTLAPDTGEPCSRDSVAYFSSEEEAQEALDSWNFTFRLDP